MAEDSTIVIRKKDQGLNYFKVGAIGLFNLDKLECKQISVDKFKPLNIQEYKTAPDDIHILSCKDGSIYFIYTTGLAITYIPKKDLGVDFDINMIHPEKIQKSITHLSSAARPATPGNFPMDFVREKINS